LCIGLGCALAASGCGSEFTAASGDAGTPEDSSSADSAGGFDSSPPRDSGASVDGIVPSDGPLGIGDSSVVDGPVVGEASGVDGPVTTCAACSATQYCNEASGLCTDCADLSRLEFVAPVLVPAVSNGPGNDQLFPRIGVTGAGWEMVYVFTDPVSTNTELAATTNWGTTQGTSLPVSINNSLQSGPLLLPPGSTLFGATAGPGSALLLYDNPSSGKRSIWSASAGTSGGTIAELQGEVNSGVSDSHIAVALKALGGARVWWTSTRSVGPSSVSGLFTFPIAGGGNAVYVPLDLDNGCHCQDADVEPWVTPDGAHLFFSCAGRDPTTGCTTTLDAGHKHLYRTMLDPSTGLQLTGSTVRLTVVDQDGVDDRTPSFSPDMCGLYFSSARRAQNFDILLARRR
jgi:hypothetical protein